LAPVRRSRTIGVAGLVALVLAAVAGCGGESEVTTEECLERWNTGKHELRGTLASMWKTYALSPPPAASAWVGRTEQEPDRCAVVAQIEPSGGYIVYDEITQDKPGAFETDADEHMRGDAGAKKLEDPNAVGAPGGKLMLK
jgi:hypothetical protein